MTVPEAYLGEIRGQAGDAVQTLPGGRQEREQGSIQCGPCLSYAQGDLAATKLQQVGKQHRV